MKTAVQGSFVEICSWREIEPANEKVQYDHVPHFTREVTIRIRHLDWTELKDLDFFSQEPIADYNLFLYGLLVLKINVSFLVNPPPHIKSSPALKSLNRSTTKSHSETSNYIRPKYKPSTA